MIRWDRSGHHAAFRRSGDRMEKGLILGGLLGLNHIHEKAPKTPSENDILVGLAENDSVSHNACINGLISEKKATILVSLFLTFVPFLQYLCYHLYEHGWYPFWAFLIFGTISLGLVGLAGNIVGTNVNLRMKRRRRHPNG